MKVDLELEFVVACAGRNFPSSSEKLVDEEEAVGMASGAMRGRASDEADDTVAGETEEDVSGVDVELRDDEVTLVI